MPRPDGAPVPASGRRTGEKAVESMEKAGLGSDSAIRAGVVAEFLAMCPYPHGSWNEGALVEWYLQRLAALGARAQVGEDTLTLEGRDRLEGGTAFCSVTKDGGDDIDATHGLLITAAVTRQPGEEITLLRRLAEGRA